MFKKREKILSCFVTSIDTHYRHLSVMFASDYGSDHPNDTQKDQISKDILKKEVEYYVSNLEREHPNENIKNPISKCGQYATLKYARWCKCFNLCNICDFGDKNGDIITIEDLKGHKVKATYKVAKYDFNDPNSGKKCIGVCITTPKIEIYAL